MLNRFPSIAAALAVCVVAAVAATPVAAKDARQIFKTAMERYEKRLAPIESITIVQDVMGMETTVRLEKVMIEDRPVLVPQGAGKAGDPGSMYRNLDSMAESATVKGTEQVDGHACWAIHVTELAGMEVGAEGTNDFESSDGTLYIDKKGFMVRRMMMNGVAMRDGEKHPVSMEMNLTDYREVDGWLHPFKTEMTLAGEGGEESPDIAKMRKAMAEMKKQMAEMDPDEREMMEKMMKGRMPQLDEGGEEGKFKVTMTVKEIRVNEPAE